MSNRPPSDPSELPIEIDDSETIVRAIVTPAHYKKGKLRPAAFRPPPGKSAVSVMRQIMGDDFCKSKGADIGRSSPSQTYVGLLTIKASSIRSNGSTVTDSRDVYLGHADLDHGFQSVPNEPNPSAEFIQMTERCENLKEVSVFHVDPNAHADGWTGPPLKMD